MSAARTAGFFTFGVPPDSYRLPHPQFGLPVIWGKPDMRAVRIVTGLPTPPESIRDFADAYSGK